MGELEALNNDQLALVKRTVAKGCTDDELGLFMYVANRTGLDPLTRQIYAIKRHDKKLGREVMTIQVSIDGARAVAQETGLMGGQDGPYWCGPDGQWVDFWANEGNPTGAKVVVYRHYPGGSPLAFTGLARWSSYVQTDRNGEPAGLWAKMGPEMLAKCAEALALRKAFPLQLSGVYTADEMGQATNAPRPERVQSTESPLDVPLSHPAPSRGETPMEAPQKALDGDIAGPPAGLAAGGPPRNGPAALVGRRLDALSEDSRAKASSLALHAGLGDLDEHLPPGDANRWLAIIEGVSRGEQSH